MERINLGYSTKNVPMPKEKEYLQRLIEKSEKFIRALRWRTFFYLNPNNKPATKNTFGFTSTKAPPFIAELKDFEDGIHNLIRTIEFKPIKNQFQNQLSDDIRKIKRGDQLTVPADKTTNFYKVNPDKYNKLLQDNITKDYKKAPPTMEKDINKEDKRIATNLQLADRINSIAKNEAFITLKDHKPNFNNKPCCRLINPAKSQIGKISKQILEKINYSIKQTTKLNQWKNTNEVIQWFNKIDNKSSYSFICFDIVEFYPSISKELLTKALDFAANYYTITEQEKSIIIHTKKSLLYDNQTPWCKKNTTNFDVTMGSYDGAETCELIGLYILSQLQHLDINVGLYRDDGLAVCRKPPRQIEQIKKEMCKIFNSNNLKITIEANLKSVNFLDVTIDLRTGTCSPYMKPNNTPLYVHKDSNHPPSIIRNLPPNINRRLSSISSNKDIFNNAKKEYQAALNQSGYNYNLDYDPPASTNNNSNNKRSRKRNITWFNPPYSNNVKTNIGRRFLTLIDKCFPPSHHLSKLINRNNIKVSYSCMPNIGQIISSHNRKILKTINPPEDKPSCNCRNPALCPLDGKCLTPCIIYQATVKQEDNNKQETYIGLTETTFKARYNNHTNSFRDQNKRHSTTLSQYIWTLKDKDIPYSIQWKIIDKGNPFSTSSNCCNLCLKEKYYIICKPQLATLNSRNELNSLCRHRRKHLLCNLK